MHPAGLAVPDRQARLADPLPQAEKARRSARAKEVAAKTAQAYRAQFIGRTLTVLFEHPAAQDTWQGHSAYCFPVQASHPGIGKNQLLPVRITGLTADGLCGQAML